MFPTSPLTSSAPHLSTYPPEITQRFGFTRRHIHTDLPSRALKQSNPKGLVSISTQVLTALKPHLANVFLLLSHSGSTPAESVFIAHGLCVNESYIQTRKVSHSSQVNWKRNFMVPNMWFSFLSSSCICGSWHDAPRPPEKIPNRIFFSEHKPHRWTHSHLWRYLYYARMTARDNSFWLFRHTTPTCCSRIYPIRVLVVLLPDWRSSKLVWHIAIRQFNHN